MPVFVKGDKRVLFVHVPKTGGKSVERLFMDSGWSMHLWSSPKAERGFYFTLRCPPQHLHAAQLRRLLKLRTFDLVLMVVRDPLARFRSEYLHGAGGPVALDAASVDQWAHDVFARYERNPYVRDNHLRPQVEFELPRSEVYRLEDGLDAAIESVDRRHGLGLNGTLPHAGHRVVQAGVSSRDVEISPSLERRLRDRYADDFRRFGY
jgi:hypothetical protein